MGPRDLLIADHRKLFGRAREVRWVEPADEGLPSGAAGGPSDGLVMVRAAQIQHDAALAFWARVQSHGLRVGDMAALLHVNAEGLRRKLRGESWASLRDVALWQLEVERGEPDGELRELL